MAPPALAPRPGVRKQLPVKLPSDIEIDLHIFCEVHYGASRTRVIAEALTAFIAAKRADDPVLDREFAQTRAAFMQSYEVKTGRPTLVHSSRTNRAPGRLGPKNKGLA